MSFVRGPSGVPHRGPAEVWADCIDTPCVNLWRRPWFLLRLTGRQRQDAAETCPMPQQNPSGREERVMNVRELIEKLSRLDPELVVVMEQEDEPLGQYEVLDVDTHAAKPHDIYHRSAPRGTWDYPQVWSTWDGGDQQVVLLSGTPAWKPVLEGELVQREIESS